MDDFIPKLRRAGRTHLADILEAKGALPLAEYSARLWDHSPGLTMEPALVRAFALHFGEMGLGEDLAQRALDRLSRRRVLQTATHLTVSEGPTFYAVHQAALAGMPKDELYLVGAFSGVPFSNPAWSGCLNYSDRHELAQLIKPDSTWYARLLKDDKNRAADMSHTHDRRISLIPARMRDGLVYGSRIPERMQELLQVLQPELGQVFPIVDGDDFSRWALRSSENVAKRLFDLPALYFDLNRVLADYLQEVLPDKDHPLHALLFNPRIRNSVISALGDNTPLFYASRQSKKRLRTEVLRLADGQIRGKWTTLELEPDEICRALGDGLLCPGVFLTFFALSFVNGFRCLGSFEQVEYLQRFKGALKGLGPIPDGDLDRASTSALTSGRMLDPEGLAIYPLDVILGTRPACDTRVSLEEWIVPLQSRLLDWTHRR